MRSAVTPECGGAVGPAWVSEQRPPRCRPPCSPRQERAPSASRPLRCQPARPPLLLPLRERGLCVVPALVGHGHRAAAASTPTARLPTPREPTPARPDLAKQLAVFQAALPGSRGEAYLQQRGISLELALQYGVGYAAPGSGRHAARDGAVAAWSFPIRCRMEAWSTSTGCAVGTAEEVPKAKRHDHLPGEKGYFNAAALHADVDPL